LNKEKQHEQPKDVKLFPRPTKQESLEAAQQAFLLTVICQKLFTERLRHLTLFGQTGVTSIFFTKAL